MISMRRTFPATRFFISSLLALTLFLCADGSAMAESAPFAGFHVFDPVKWIPGSSISKVAPDPGPIGYLNRTSPDGPTGRIVSSRGWHYSPENTAANTSSIAISYTVIDYDEESAARDVVNAVFSEAFIDEFLENTAQYNQKQYQEVVRQTHPSDSIIGFVNDPSLYPGKQTTDYRRAPQAFLSYAFSRPNAACGDRQVIKTSSLRYGIKKTGTIVKTPQKGWIRHDEVEISGKVISSQGYYRILRSGSALMVLKVVAGKTGEGPNLRKPVGDSTPPDMLKRYWQIIEQESRNFVCKNSSGKNIVITLSMPKTNEMTRSRRRVFGPAFPDFQTAHISGFVTYEDLFHEGYVSFADITATVIYMGRTIRTRSVKTDAYGNYDLTLPINLKGSRPSEEIKANIIRRLGGSALPPSAAPISSIATHNPSHGKQANDWKITFWNRQTKLNALEKDREFQKFGGRGTPNMERWSKNHLHGQDNITALKFIVDLGAAPSTKSSQMVENVNITYKRITGKPLSFIITTEKLSPNAMKTAGKLLYKRFKYQGNVDTGK